MAHILLLTQYYPPEVGADQTHLGETAAELVRLGHTVTVLTTLPNYPLGIVPEEYKHGNRRREVINGVNVVRVWSYIAPNRGFLQRIIPQLSFGLFSGILGARAIGQPDIIIVLSPPLFTAVSGRFLSMLKRCPYIFHVADVWPDAAVEMGHLHNKTIIALAEALERWAYRHAAALWTISEGCRKALIQHDVPPGRIFVVPIGANTQLLRPIPKAEARAELGWADKFTVVHCGTIGPTSHLDTLLLAAAQLKAYSDIQFILVGDGAKKAEWMAEAEQKGLTNITFLGLQPHERIPTFIGAADVCLATFRNDAPLFEGTMPVRMYEAMACGRPLILGASGEARKLAEEDAGAAITVNPDSPEDLANAVLSLYRDQGRAERMGRQGRAYIEAHLSREDLTSKLNRHITDILEGTAEREMRNPVTVASQDHAGAASR